MNENFELENMRQQMETLKKKLDQQEIVNDRFIRQSMKKNADNIIRRYHILMAIGLIMIPYGYWCFVKISGFSIAFWIGTCIFMLICAGATYYNSRNVSDTNMMRNSLVDVRRKMARAKKFDADWLFFGIPAVILWLAWFFYEVYKIDNTLLEQGLFWGGCVGGVIGAVIGLKTHFKTQRQYQEIIDQIEDITAE
jgi:hypothetical protein